MFKTLKNLLAGILAAAIVIAIGASTYTVFAAPVTTNSGNGTGASVLDISTSNLSADEAASLLFMREEEKLARDVYNTLYTTWGIRTFSNIASSEQQHMDQIKLLLDRYALTDPALAPGQFTDPALQTLYTQLIAQGNLSPSDALKVGAAIEEIDILDLQTRMAQTDNADIQWVYTNLMKASYNHLRAYTNILSQQTGETYQPQYLSAEQYQTIISSTNGNGNQGGNSTGGQVNNQTYNFRNETGRPLWAGGNGNGNRSNR